MSETKNLIEPIKLLVSIVERQQGYDLSRLYQRHGVDWHYQSTGLGTASSELLDVLGFGSSERDVLFSLAPKRQIERLMYLMNDELRTETTARGILFDLPLTGANYLFALSLAKQSREAGCQRRKDAAAKKQAEQNGDESSKETQKANLKSAEEDKTRSEETISDSQEGMFMPYSQTNSLILIVVNQGHTDAVMDTARKSGARGGTILKARSLGSEESSHFYGITLQKEKEILAIIVPNQSRNVVMEAVSQKHGADSEAGAVICSLGVDHVVRLT